MLRRDARLTRGRLLALAGLSEERQRAVYGGWTRSGRLPRGGHESPKSITLPRERGALAKALVRRLGAEEAAAVQGEIAAALCRGR